jgi:uncharacterized membrane protein YbhN (UPF0104 family)
MNAVDTAVPAATGGGRRWPLWVALLALVALALLIALSGGLRALLADAWRELWAIPLPALGLIVALKVGQALLSSLSWYNALRTAWPRSGLAYRFVVGVDQGQDVVNTVLPARAGTWTMLGVIRLAIPEARVPTLVAVWGVHNLAFLLFAAATSALVVAGVPGREEGGDGLLARLGSLATDHPLAATAVAAAIAIALLVTARRGHGALTRFWNQLRAGFTILRSPGRYLRLLFLPALASYVLRCAAYVVLLSAFDIPVTVWTVALALGSHALAGAVRVTPGGLGTTQAVDVVALQAYAPPEVVTAYSLAEIALNAVVSLAVAVGALVSLGGWHGSRRMVGHLRRGNFAAGMRALGVRGRSLRPRTLPRWRARRR